MANIKEIRTRIESVASTRQITSAMKMVAAAKLKKAQDAVINLRPYALEMQGIMIDVISSVGRNEHNVYTDERDYSRVLIVVVTSNRGLCGAFNSNVIKEAMQLAESKYSKHLTPEKIRFMSIGKKGNDTLRKRKVPLDEPHTGILENPTYENVSEIAHLLMDAFVAGRYDSVDIVYNEFINAASQKVVYKQFLPLLPEQHPVNDKEKNKKKGTATHVSYLFEPHEEHILTELAPQYLRLILHEALLESVASEFGARMTSMHQATDNATTLIQELTLQYNKARQAAITNEILEIVGGAEALKG
jgi:F-type H+-transporting ATPase subunit gamma